MFEVVGSTVIAGTFLFATWLVTGKRLRAGFTFGAAAQFPALAYNVITGQPGFALLAVFSLAFYVRGLRNLKTKNQLATELKPECAFMARYGACVHCEEPYGATRS